MAISGRVGPRYSTWSTLTFVTTATGAATMLVASQVPPTPTSTTATSTASLANQSNAAGGEDLEVAGPVPRNSSTVATRVSTAASIARR